MRAGSQCSLLLAGITARKVAAETPATTAAVTSAAAEVRIAFANTSIQDWRVVDDQTILIQALGNKWYKVRLMSPCTDLPFTERVGFESNPDGSFDRFSTVRARGQTCQVASLTRTTPPPKKDGKKAAEPPTPGG